MSSGHDVAASVEERPRAGGALEREAATDRAPDDDRVLLARRTHELDDPAVRARRRRTRAAPRRCSSWTSSSADDRLESRRAGARSAARRGCGARPRRRDSRGRCGGRSGRAAPRAAGTCPRTRSGSPSRCRRNGYGSCARHAVDGHLALGHRLEQRGLRLRRRAVDLVDEDDVGEDRPGPELEAARLLVEHRESGHVRRLEIGRALDPLRDRALDAPRDRAREDGLRRARHVLRGGRGRRTRAPSGRA